MKFSLWKILAKIYLTLIGKFLGNFWDRFSGKLIHQKIMSTYSVFWKTRSRPRPFYWKTYPIVNWKILGRRTGRFTGKLIQTKCYLSYTVSITKFEWMSFPVKGSVWRPRIEKKLRYSGFLMDEFSSKTACMTTRKMKISEKFLDEFSMICQ